MLPEKTAIKASITQRLHQALQKCTNTKFDWDLTRLYGQQSNLENRNVSIMKKRIQKRVLSISVRLDIWVRPKSLAPLALVCNQKERPLWRQKPNSAPVFCFKVKFSEKNTYGYHFSVFSVHGCCNNIWYGSELWLLFASVSYQRL